MDLRSFKIGLAAGLVSKGRMPKGEQKERMYLYNGVELPKIPDWDKEEYPYAVLAYAGDGARYWLYVSKYKPFYSTMDFNGSTHSGAYAPLIGMAVGEMYVFNDGKWAYYDNFDDGYVPIYAEGVGFVWSNLDILDDDGSIYQSAGTTNDPDAPATPAEPTPICVDKSIKYQYGDYTLPALPEFDIRVYPYICIHHIANNMARVYACRMAIIDNVRMPRHHLMISFNKTEAFEAFDNWAKSDLTFMVGHQYIYWSNHDIYDIDRNVVVEGSDPIPVYE